MKEIKSCTANVAINTINISDKKMVMSPLRRVLSALLGGSVDKIPVTSIAGCGGTTTVAMQNATGIFWPDAHKNAEKMAKLAMSSYNLTGIENVRVPFDFVVEAEALGCEIQWWSKPEIVPSVRKGLFTDPQDLRMPDNLLEEGRIPVVLNAIRILREEVGDFLPISSLALGPFSLASDLVGVNNFLRWTLKKPEFIKKFVDFATEIVIEYAKAQYRAGSHIVEIADALASLDCISPNMFREFVQPSLTKIANALGGIRVLHICGRTREIIPDIVKLGFEGISLEEDISIIKQNAMDVKILGNVSSKKTLVFNSPLDVKAETKKALELGVDLLEPDCGFSPVTPIENIKAMVEARDEFYR